MKKGRVWLYVLIIFAVLAIIGIFYYFWGKTCCAPKPATSASSQTKSPENWIKNSQVLFENVTSSDTHKLDDGTFRMYFMQNGKIVYADSKDATTFDSPISTGIGENLNKFISNPSVLRIADNNWIMVYEEQPMKQPGQEQGPPGPQSQRNLLLATSTDGKNFTPIGTAVNSAKDDNYFASVPDLIKTPESKIRLYYVCGGEATCSAISDDGKSFTKEAGIRMADKAVDPDVSYRDGQWIMYFSTLDGANNKFYKATSSDGLAWQKGEIILKPDSEKGAIVDPDVVEIAPEKWRMFFGEMAEGIGQMGSQVQINLFWADFNGNIF